MYTISDNSTSTTVTANGTIINSFPTTITYTIDDLVNISTNLDPAYEFSSWSSDSVAFNPGANNPIANFYASNHDTVVLNLVKKPSITYVIDPPTTLSSMTIDGARLLY